MKKIIKEIVKDYLSIFNEENRLVNLIYFLDSHNNKEIIDWNNFEGHIVSSAFIYAKKDKKFLVLYHKDMEMYVYPGGHIEKNDKDPLETAKREVYEETGITDYKNYIINNNPLIPLDISINLTKFNYRLNLPEHYHFDFRYLFVIDNIEKITLDKEESDDYKWIDICELYKISNCKEIVFKIKKIINKNDL